MAHIENKDIHKDVRFAGRILRKIMPVWNTASNEAAWSLYLEGIEDVPIYAAPARAFLLEHFRYAQNHFYAD